MDSSSIVSFNNDSTFQATVKADYNVNVHELALHAMRDRCLLLQRRINTLENDNMRLKLQSSQTSPYIPLQDDEKATLEQKIAELNKQKSQLLHHIFMVSCENKTLWTKISSIKGSNKQLKEGKNPLVRTNTYIQSTPRTSSNYQEKYSESSLEEISLKLINSYIQEKSQLVEQYEQMTQLQDTNDYNILNADSIGFTYIEEPATDSLKEIKSHTEKLHNLKKDLEQQESDLKLILAKVETIMKEGHKCPTCILNNARVVSSEHKEIETSDSLVNWETPVASNTYNNFSEINTSVYRKSVIENEKDTEGQEFYDKICPMCGQTFQKDVAFTEFQTHVENHFVGESDADTLDNFDNLPSSFDNLMQ